jgi:cytochrome c oxidase subunit 4
MTMSPRKTLGSAAIALLVLTVISWGLAHVALGHAAVPVALAIAAVKASVVAIAFMEISHAHVAARIVGIVTLSFIAILCLGLVADVGLR